ncbi:hypothetical protein EYF80_056949 [Liparis tanakae]|uniref:Uncharacterized protein n=1 Tax=Liparis tanakae TaxID=230148 RepID=A0A4Z2EVB5_9TELE|nr:hypothetical protein EYF80_056949 [Liparis tanakae]
MSYLRFPGMGVTVHGVPRAAAAAGGTMGLFKASLDIPPGGGGCLSPLLSSVGTRGERKKKRKWPETQKGEEVWRQSRMGGLNVVIIIIIIIIVVIIVIINIVPRFLWPSVTTSSVTRRFLS